LTSEDYQLMSLSNCASINTDTIDEKHIPSHINYLDTGNICGGHVITYQLLSSKNNIPSRARRIVKQRDIVYSTVRPNQKHFGLLVSIPENCIVSTGFSVIRSNDPHISNEMLYLELTSSGTIDYLQSIAESSTSTYPSIKADDLGEIEVPVGKNSDKLIDTLKKIFDAVNNNDCMNEKLKDIRDILLPKMMSGEIDISKLDLSS
jgi:type I restriction enzyme, S subunit